MDRPPTSPRRASTAKKGRYHHGNLRASALRRGRELVASGGPDALTLRGLARELGVTAPALVHHFGSRAGLRSAVAASILEEAEAAAFARPKASEARPTDLGAAWIAFAVDNPQLYRLACGEGWRAQPLAPNGIDAGGLAVRSPRRVLHDALVRRSRHLGRPHGDISGADRLASTIHGLALARMDGARQEVVAEVLGRLAPHSDARPSA